MSEDYRQFVSKSTKTGLSLRDPVEFLESIPDIYTSTPTPARALREVVTQFVARINIANFIL